jgi:hypothetical protein
MAHGIDGTKVSAYLQLSETLLRAHHGQAIAIVEAMTHRTDQPRQVDRPTLEGRGSVTALCEGGSRIASC